MCVARDPRLRQQAQFSWSCLLGTSEKRNEAEGKIGEDEGGKEFGRGENTEEEERERQGGREGGREGENKKRKSEKRAKEAES